MDSDGLEYAALYPRGGGLHMRHGSCQAVHLLGVEALDMRGYEIPPPKAIWYGGWIVCMVASMSRTLLEDRLMYMERIS